MRGATHWPHGLLLQQPRISIHAPHARSDSGEPPPTWAPYFISIHAPHARSDSSVSSNTNSNRNFNPRSSCEERPALSSWWRLIAQFQSTLLMRGATLSPRSRPPAPLPFQSTLLMRGATLRRCPNRTQSHHFNPRSSCEERPAVFLDLFLDVVNFNPRSSCEERRHFPESLAARRYFNPRSSCEERPMLCTASRRCANFNPRSSCEERRRWRALISTRWYFNPRSSCEERRGLGSASCTATEFQSTLLMRGATIAKTQFKFDGTFQSTLLMRGATIGTRLLAMMSDEFQSTLLMRGATSLVA